MPTRSRSLRAVVLVLALSTAALGCSDDGDGSTTTTTRRAPSAEAPAFRQPALEGTVTVMAADTLVGAMPLLVDDFNVLNPGVQVSVRFDAAPVLAMELLDGLPADVFISSDEDNMNVLVEAGRTDGPPRVLARNRLVIVTAPGNPEGIETLADLDGAGEIALCESDVPCGALADQVLDTAGVEPDDINREPGLLEAVAAVLDGDSAAALVFATTAEAAGDAVDVVELDASIAAASAHTVATLAPAVNALAARAFVDFVLSPEGQDILADQGFIPPG